MSELEFLAEPETIVFAVPIVAILAGAVIVVVKLLLKHRERMALIEQGLHPDYPLEGEDTEEDTSAMQ